MNYRSYLTKEELAEMRREFKQWEKERYGYDDTGPKKPQKAKRQDVPMYKNFFEELVELYIDEAINYYLKERTRWPDTEIDGTYLYKKSELDTFLNRYKEKGGDLNKLHIGPVYYTKRKIDIMCYEVSTKKFWEAHKDKYYARE